MFHSESFIKKLDATPGCKWVEFNCGHWMAITEPDRVSEEIIKFVSNN